MARSEPPNGIPGGLRSQLASFLHHLSWPMTVIPAYDCAACGGDPVASAECPAGAAAGRCRPTLAKAAVTLSQLPLYLREVFES